MSKKITTYVLIVSRTFPSYHPRKGQDTNFEDRILQIFYPKPEIFLNGKWTRSYKMVNTHTGEEFVSPCPKIHTIRGNYDLWKKRIDKVNEGKAVLSLRYWSGKPYHSEQVEFLHLTKVGIQKVDFGYDYFYNVIIDDNPGYDSDVIAGNDGLSFSDFEHWFCKADLSKPMAIIHFTDFRY